MKNNNAMKLSFDDALLVTLFGTKDRKDTMDRLAAVCTVFPEEELRTKAFILKEQIGQISDFVWPELLRQTKWNMDNSIGLDRYSWDMEAEVDEDDDLDDEDDAYGC
ncbi:MAG: hypothetical protein IK026_01360 [Eubacteriaceae bacterium]|nr:hypothetical protein [Eubacteriaceae bacterium]